MRSGLGGKIPTSPMTPLGERLDRLHSLLGRALEPVRPDKNRVRIWRFMHGRMYE
jgi:hypothetical protein